MDDQPFFLKNHDQIISEKDYTFFPRETERLRLRRVTLSKMKDVRQVSDWFVYLTENHMDFWIEEEIFTFHAKGLMDSFR